MKKRAARESPGPSGSHRAVQPPCSLLQPETSVASSRKFSAKAGRVFWLWIQFFTAGGGLTDDGEQGGGKTGRRAIKNDKTP